MKESTTSNGKRGSMFKGSNHSSQAENERWDHGAYEQILQQEKEQEKSFGSKKSLDYSNGPHNKDESTSSQQNSTYHHHQQQNNNYNNQGGYKQNNFNQKKGNYYQDYNSNWDNQSYQHYGNSYHNHNNGGGMDAGGNPGNHSNIAKNNKRGTYNNNSNPNGNTNGNQFYSSNDGYNKKFNNNRGKMQNNNSGNYNNHHHNNNGGSRNNYNQGNNYNNKTSHEGGVRNLKSSFNGSNQVLIQTLDGGNRKKHLVNGTNNSTTMKKDKQNHQTNQQHQQFELATAIMEEQAKNFQRDQNDEDLDKNDTSSQNSGNHRQIKLKQKTNLLYVLNLKLIGLEVTIEIQEQDTIEEIIEDLAFKYKLAADFQDALETYIIDRLEKEGLQNLVNSNKFEQIIQPPPPLIQHQHFQQQHLQQLQQQQIQAPPPLNNPFNMQKLLMPQYDD
ncbi:UNKNOWN [Stylonychia lemnae]|uniref:Uncharacterized protein n=1 Tax=Stylonychia lemnae TaxID=5949 RepID=A0A077ZXA2_STYLE|nr:UNKNOWN [Stylonychia lemnae]|eukprot:CDW73166.1 UNKNOWN [Stylonychia lemnae]